MPDSTQSDPVKRVGVFLPKTMRDALKILAIKEDKTVQDLGVEAFSTLLKNRKEAA